MENSVSHFVEKLVEWDNSKIPPPSKITIFPTVMCNTRCRFCLRNIKPTIKNKKTELSTEQWIKIIKEGLKLGVAEWEICGGGEPMTQKEKTMAIIKTLKKNQRLYCQIITNGLNLNKSDVLNLVKIRLDKLSISLEGSNPKYHDSLVGMNGAFNKIMGTLHIFRHYKKEYNSIYPIIVFKSILTKNLLKNLKDLIIIAKIYGVSEIQLQPLEIFPQTKKIMGALQIKENEFSNILKKLEYFHKIALQCGVILNYESICITKSNLNNYDDNKNKLKSLSYKEKTWSEKIAMLKKRGNFDKAIDIIHALLKQYKNNPVLLFQLGECLMEKKQYTQAIRTMKQAISKRPEMDWIWFSLGKCYYFKNQFLTSLKYLDKNLRICKDPLSHFHTWYFKALNNEKLKNKSKVNTCLKQVALFQKYFAHDELPEEVELLKRYYPKKYPSLKLKKKSLVEIKRTSFHNKLLMALCYEPFFGMVIDMYGGIAPCCVPEKGNERINVSKMSLKKIWNGTSFKKLRQNALNRKPNTFCKRCSIVHRTNVIREALKTYFECK